MANKRRLIGIVIGLIVLVVVWIVVYRHWIMPTRILIVNPLQAQAVAIALNNDSKDIRVTCVTKENAHHFDKFDAILLYGMSLFLDEEQTEELEYAAQKGIPIFTKSVRHSQFSVNRNLSTEEQGVLQTYLTNDNQHNYRNFLRYMRHIATPDRWGDQDYEEPIVMPDNLFYHREYGKYFDTPDELTKYLQEKGIYNKGGRTLGLIGGINLPTEGNRDHIDTLITKLTESGFNVYPIAGYGNGRANLIRKLHPDAMVYLATGRIGNDSLTNWLHAEHIPIFVPFPLARTREEWLDDDKPITGGVLTARVVLPEVDGAIYPLCIATQNETGEGFLRRTPEIQRIDAFVEHINKYMALRDKANKDKRIAICYFKKPGNDALIASGMEVVPSLYNFLLRLREEGYNVDGLPATVEEFGARMHKDGAVMGAYARGAQENFMNTAHPVWLSSKQYEQWAQETLLPEKYAEVIERYGEAPGDILARGDSLAVACVQYGNVLLFPQPRPAIGEDDFKLVHGAKVAPPHNYIAAYLYMNKGFSADAIIHFGTHGNLEFTPGKNVGLKESDWSDALLANLPHFYFYTTANVGEGTIAKRRTHAALVTYLTPPYAESGMRQRLSSLLDDIHKALEEDNNSSLGIKIKRETVKLGLHRDLGLDSLLTTPYSREELEQLDNFAEEIANEKMQGAYYTLGKPYNNKDLMTTVLAVAADPLAYEMATRDRDKGVITTEQLKDFSYVNHHYLADAKRRITALLQNPPRDTALVAPELRPALMYKDLFVTSTSNEFNTMVNALNGGTIYPTPGGDPVLNPNVLPTGRNMYSINAEATPNEKAWEDGKRIAEETIKKYVDKHGEYPRKISYTFWAGEFITTEGATLAQAFWMLCIEPVRDQQGRVVDLKLVPSEELGRPRINVVVQVSGQLRDIAASRLKMITEAVRLASEAKDDVYPNYVAEGTLTQEAELVQKGVAPKQAREMSTMRVFGPVNNGYSTGIMGYTENSGTWEKENEIAQGYLNNMGAAYGDDENWGGFQKDLFASALSETDVVIQPRQSNTWGPLSLDHVYEFTGGLSLAVKTVTGKEPEAYMADYRNRNNRRLQDAKEAIAVETRSTILNPTYIRERMKGGASTAEMFGKLFRNIFGWNVMRPSSIDPKLYDDLYELYVEDAQNLGIHSYFKDTNPAALQSITAVMMESARKGYWKATDEQLKTTAKLHADVTKEKGAACTEFVCGNDKLDAYISSNLDAIDRKDYDAIMRDVFETGTDNGKEVVLKKDSPTTDKSPLDYNTIINDIAIILVVLAVIFAIVIIRKKRK